MTHCIKIIVIGIIVITKTSPPDAIFELKLRNKLHWQGEGKAEDPTRGDLSTPQTSSEINGGPLCRPEMESNSLWKSLAMVLLWYGI